MKKFLYILVAIIGLSSCSEYQKALQSEDVATKFKMGTELYDAGKFAKANRLFVQIVPNYRGKPQAEKLMYMYSNTFYEMEDYYLAGYQFERFVNSYPKSEKVEEAAYISVKSYYMLSPVYTKEQKETIEAIEKLQLFINTYPSSEYITEVNNMVKELDSKLELKSYSIAKQYNQIEDHQASVKGFDNFLLEYPGTKLREDALYYRADSAYKLAINSVYYKKEVRLKTAQSYISSFKNKYPNSKNIESVNKMSEEVKEDLQAYNTKS